MVASLQMVRRISRAEAATANGFETLGLYAGGVVAANAAGVAVPTVNKLSLGYLGARIVFNYIYVVLQDNARLAPLRSLTWMVSVGCITSLYVAAGIAVN